MESRGEKGGGQELEGASVSAPRAVQPMPCHQKSLTTRDKCLSVLWSMFTKQPAGVVMHPNYLDGRKAVPWMVAWSVPGHCYKSPLLR